MVPRVMCNGVEVLAMGMRCDEVGGSGIESGQWVAGYYEGCGAGSASSFSMFPANESQMRCCEVKFIIALGCLQNAGIELHFPIASFVCVSGELVWSLWISC